MLPQWPASSLLNLNRLNCSLPFVFDIGRRAGQFQKLAFVFPSREAFLPFPACSTSGASTSRTSQISNKCIGSSPDGEFFD